MRHDECAGQDEARPALAGGDPPAEVYPLEVVTWRCK